MNGIAYVLLVNKNCDPIVLQKNHIRKVQIFDMLNWNWTTSDTVSGQSSLYHSKEVWVAYA